MKYIMMILAVLAATSAVGDDEKLKNALQAGWQGNKVCELLYEDENIRTLRCTFPPGVGHERHYHPPHFGYILSGGTMRVTDANGERVVGSVASTGMTWQSDGVAWHEVLNIGKTTTQYLITEQK